MLACPRSSCTTRKSAPPELLLDGTPVSQGWLAGKAVYGARTLSCTRHTRQWLQSQFPALLAPTPTP